jgi:hypothetical protein
MNSKRNFTNFHDFPGELNEGSGIYEFPRLRHIDDKDKIRNWQIFVRLIKSGKPQTSIDWELLEEKQVIIKREYFNIESDYENIPNGVVAEAWVETGVEGGKSTRTAPTYFAEEAFKGQINVRNPFQQALIYARSQYLKRKEKGGTENANGNKKVKGNLGTVKYFPMLAKTYKDGAKHLHYPLYIQPKLDGVRCLVYLKKKDGGVNNVVVYSRTQKDFPSMDYLKNALYEYLNDLFDEENKQSIYLDGELYVHGKKLQDISGESRNEKKRNNIINTKKTIKQTKDQKEQKEESKETKEQKLTHTQNEYHVYDCFYPLELNTEYEQRKEQLDVLFSAIKDNNDTKIVKPVKTIKVNNESEAVRQYKKFITEGYEGAILRNVNGIYLANANRTGAFMRSIDLVKMKKKFTDEFEVIDYTEGKRGKDKGAIIWVAQTADGIKFNVTPKDITYEKRYEIYKECKDNFDKLYKGRMLTIEYEDLSKTKVPQRAKALIFRDYE